MIVVLDSHRCDLPVYVTMNDVPRFEETVIADFPKNYKLHFSRILHDVGSTSSERIDAALFTGGISKYDLKTQFLFRIRGPPRQGATIKFEGPGHPTPSIEQFEFMDDPEQVMLYF